MTSATKGWVALLGRSAVPVPQKPKRPSRRTVFSWNAGEKNPNVKLSMEKARAIRVRLAAGDTLRKIAADYGVSVFPISCIKRGVAWKEPA